MATLEKSELDIALERLTPEWLAGFFDGEGTVSCVLHHGTMPSLIVNVSQADYEILALIGLKFGGERKPYKKYSKVAHWKQGWSLAFGGKSALPFLEYIAPHVILKRKLVEWGIEMAKLHLKAGGNRRWNKGKMDPDVLSRRKQLFSQIRAENKSGRVSNKKVTDDGGSLLN